MTGKTAPQTRSATDICLVVPPFDSILFPALGVSILSSSLKARGFTVKIVFGSLLLASRIGADVYRTICNSPIKELLGERLFAREAYAPDVFENLGPGVPFLENRQDIFDQNIKFIGPFVQALTRQILATRPKIVGITSNFQQNMAAMALVRHLKMKAPDICVVLGGANMASPMGDELAKVSPGIDYYFSGESDITFPDFCERLLREGQAPQSRAVQCPPLEDMSRASAPDFTDYFTTLRHFQRRSRLPATLPEFLTMESSRGCWWGQKNHCTFCGLNAEGMSFRRKPTEAVYEEIRDLTEKWNIGRFHFSDNIMPLEYLHDLLPRLAEWPKRPHLFFEVKANLKDEQLRQLARGGVDMIQPGIESLSTHVLKLMRKGVSAAQNIALLRSARSVGIGVLWNLLYGFPGEQRQDYESTLWLMDRIDHLQPPSGLNKVVIDRFSPYHFDYEKFGIKSITPFDSYRAIYPKQTDLSKVAYHFSGEFTTPVLDDHKLLTDATRRVARWKEQWQGAPPVLNAMEVKAGRWMVTDTRRIARERLVPVSREAIAALAYFERPRPLGGNHDGHDTQIEALLEHDFVVAYEDTLVSLVTRKGPAIESIEKTGSLRSLETAAP